MAILKALLMGSLALTLGGCAVLHHIQLGDVDGRTQNQVLIPFDIKVSEIGVSTEELASIARSTRTQGGNDAAAIAEIIALFQMGPRTGKPVYDARYAEKIVYEIHQKCPSGRVSGLMSIRETRAYPAISGEIVKITGFCAKARTARSTSSDENEIESQPSPQMAPETGAL